MSLDELIKYNELVYGVKPKVSKLGFGYSDDLPKFSLADNGLTQSRLKNSYLYTGVRFLLVTDGRNSQVVATPGYIKGEAINYITDGWDSVVLIPFDCVFYNETPEDFKYSIVNVEQAASFDVFLVEYDQTVNIW